MALRPHQRLVSRVLDAAERVILSAVPRGGGRRRLLAWVDGALPSVGHSDPPGLGPL
jgi:hypothetical protein